MMIYDDHVCVPVNISILISIDIPMLHIIPLIFLFKKQRHYPTSDPIFFSWLRQLTAPRYHPGLHQQHFTLIGKVLPLNYLSFSEIDPLDLSTKSG